MSGPHADLLHQALLVQARTHDGRLEFSESVDEAALWRYVRAVAEEIGADPAQWPWRSDSAEGLAARREFVRLAKRDGLEWAAASTREAAARYQGKKRRQGQRGPLQMTSGAEVERAKKELRDAGQLDSERAVARKLSVSRGAVRYALGKDRRTG